MLPFRLDYLIKVGMLRKLGGIRVGFEAIVLSIVSLGMIDAIAMLPLSISATATSGSALRGPLLIVVVFGVGCCTLLVVGGRLIRLPLLRRSRRLRTISEHVARHTTTRGRRDATVAWFYLFACWSTRAFGSAALLTALGLSFSPTTALSVICLSAAAGVIPITSGGVVVGAGATAGILLALGVGKDIAINFSLASGLLLVASAIVAALSGVLASLAPRAVARRKLRRAKSRSLDHHGEGAPVTARLDWQAFVSRFYPESARHDFRVLKAYDAYRKGLPAEQPDGPRDAEALRVWEDEGGALGRDGSTRKGRRARIAESSQLDDARCPHPEVVDPGRTS